MKNFFRFLIYYIGLLGYSIISFAGSPITVYNDSNIDMWFESHRSGCSGLIDNGCANPWTSAGVGVCCGGSGIVTKKAYATDSAHSGNINLPGGAPAWTVFYSDYPVTGHAQDGRTWNSSSSHRPGSTIRFPSDFNVSASDKTNLTPGYPQTAAAQYFSKGSFKTITNQTNEIITTPYAQIPAKGQIDATQIKAGGFAFDGKTITFNSQNATYTFEFNNTTNTITITGEIQNPQTITYKAELFLSPLFQELEKNGTQITQYLISLTITDKFAPMISELQVNTINALQGSGSTTMPNKTLIDNKILTVIQD